MTRTATQASDESTRDVLLISLLALMIACLLRAAGALHTVEWALLDWRIQLQQQADARHVMLVLESEEDIGRFGHPLPDEVLAIAISRLLDAGAVVVAVDKFRDVPVPPGIAELNALLAKSERIVWVSKFVGAPASEGMGPNQRGVPPPAVLRGSDRVGCADLVPDADGVNRRALLAQEMAGEACLSLSLVAAAHALAFAGRQVQFSEDSKEFHLGQVSVPRLQSGDGFHRASELGGFQISLAHPLNQVPAISLQQALEGDVSSVRGRLVFLGTQAVSLGDQHLVPDSRGRSVRHIPGVEVHARIAEELLRLASEEAQALRIVPLPGLLLIMLALGALGAWAGVASSSLQRGMLIWFGVVLLFCVMVPLGDAVQVRSELAAPWVAALSGLGMAWARRAQIEKRDRTQLRELFSRQVAPEVAEAIWQQRAAFFRNGRVLPVEVQVTVLFADLRGFTRITEQLDRERMVLWLNAAVSEMTESVMGQGGVVTRFGGDQVMAVFGAPVPRTSEAERRHDAAQALRAALRMGERLNALNLRNAEQGLPAARVRVGIQSGTALQCGVGSSDRFEFTVLGDAVNTASRLESLAGDDDGSAARIFAGGDTIALCGARFRHDPVAELKLKGKDIPVAVYRIAGEIE